MFNPFIRHQTKIQILSKWISDHIFELVIILLGTFILFSPPVDYDFGWHYKYGEYFWQTFKLLTQNTFSYTFTQHNFVNSYVLAEIVNYFFYHNFGVILGSVIPSALLCFTLIKFAKKSGINKTSIFFWFIVITIGLSLFQISVRPILYSTIFLYVLLYTLIFDKTLQKYLPILFLIWANTHADFVVGLFIYGIYTVAQLLKKEFGSIKYLLLATAATLVNISGINLWTTMIGELISPINAHVQEWSSPFSLDLTSKINLLVFGLLFATAGLLSVNPKDKWYKLLVIFFFLFGLKSVYMLRIVYILGSIGLLYTIEPLTKLMEKHVHVWTKNIFVLGITYIIILSTVLKMLATTNSKIWAEQVHYPYEAVRFLDGANLSGNIFNNYDWGGYLIWKLPKYKTFIDGRMTSWKQDDRYFMEDYYKITKQPQTNNFLFSTYIQKYNIRYVLDRPDSTLVKYLTTEKYSKWRLIFIDDNAVVLERKD